MKTGRTEEQLKFADIQTLYDTFQGESDRGAAIISAAYLDECLGQLIACFLIDESKGVHELLQGALRSFASRISASYYVGLISKNEHHDLNTIREIRNRFAHQQHDLSFSEPDIERACNQLALWRPLSDLLRLDSARSQFLYTTSALLMQLGLRALRARRERRVTPSEFEVTQVVR